MKLRNLFQSVFLFALIMSIFSSAYAYDVPGECNPPPYSSPPKAYTAKSASSSGETVWHIDVNSGCSWSDHHIYLDIDADPSEIKDAQITMTNWDVDYNDPQGCVGGPEVDYLYINGNFIGQLQGANNSWSTNIFDVPSNYLIKGSNHIYVDLDAPGTGCWCVGVGYVEISGMVGFRVINHTPQNDEKNVNWDKPNITVEFSQPVKESSANTDTILIEYRDQSGIYQKVDVQISMISSKKIKITPPNDKLIDGIRYRVRVLAGANGVLSESSGELAEAAEWYFWTIVDLDGTTNLEYPPNTDKDKLQITWFNVSRNKNLVPKKMVLNRIYALWDPKDNVYDDDEVTEFNAKVSLSVNNSHAQNRENWKIKRPDKYTVNEKKLAFNTINFYHNGGSGTDENYSLKIIPTGQSGNLKEFTKTKLATAKSRSSKIDFNVWACEMAGWYGGVNAGELTDAINTLNQGVEYTREVFPINGCTYHNKGTIVRGAGGFNMTYTETKYSSWWDDNGVDNGGVDHVRFVNVPVFFGLLNKEVEEIKHVLNYLTSLKPASNDFIIGIVPSDALPGATGVHMDHAILLSENNFNPSTVAHEIGHEYGIYPSASHHNDDPSGIEGFRISTQRNKSFTEGNGEASDLMPLMSTVVQPQLVRWIRNDSYEHLLGELTSAVTPSPKALAVVTGEFLVIQGYTNESNQLENILPLYVVTQQHVGGPTGTGFTAELFSGENGNGTSLGLFNFNTNDITITKNNGTMPTINSHCFSFTIPYDNSVQSIVLTGPSNSITINKSAVGVGAPTANFTYPADGATVSGDIDVTWSGSDDSGTVYYRLEYSPDSGATWIPISNQLTNITTYHIDTTLLPTGPSQKLALIAYDGFNTTRVEINITIDNYVKVKLTSPIDGAVNVSEGQTVEVYFISEMNESTINKSNILLLEGGNPVDGQVTYDSLNQRATFTPASNLKSNTTYTGRILAGGVLDTKGDTLQSNYEWTFTTGLTPQNPQVVMVSPLHGATDVPLNPIIQASFSQDIDDTTVNAVSFKLVDQSTNPVSGTVSYNDTLKSAIFIPSTNLAPNASYTATLTTAIANTYGLFLESNYSWTFTTGTSQANGVRIVGILYDQGKDTNSDGLYDKLIIYIQAEISTPGSYNLNGKLTDFNNEEIQWNSYVQSFPNKGIYVIPLEFDGSLISSHGVNGPYLLKNLYIYNTSNSSIYYSYGGAYQTLPYEFDEFYTVIRLSNIPEIGVAMNSTNDNILNLEDYAAHITYPVSSLNYSILINGNANAGVSIDATHHLDVVPVAGFTGYSDVTIEAKDQDGKRALDTFRVSVLESYKFNLSGWYLVSLNSQPADTNIQTVLAPIAGKFDIVWGFIDGAWRVYNPTQPGFNDLLEMSAGKGYWIKANQPVNFSSIGSTVEGQAINLVQGWNLVAYNSTISAPVDEVFASIAGRYLSVWAFVNGGWEVYDPNNPGLSNLSTMKSGYGYWINAIMDTTWTLP